MRLQIDKLGKVAVTVEQGYWDIKKDYDKLTIVQKEGVFGTYISRKPVPAGTELTDRVYWIPFSSLKEDIVLDYNAFIAKYGEELCRIKTHLNEIDEHIRELYKTKNAADNAVITSQLAVTRANQAICKACCATHAANEAIDKAKELVEQTNTVLGKNYINKVKYESYDDYQYAFVFYNDDKVVQAIDVEDFILDKAVEDVRFDENYENLLIVFNTDAGSKTIPISLNKIFNPEDYYTKVDANKLHTEINNAITNLTNTINELNKKVVEIKEDDFTVKEMTISDTDESLDVYTKEQVDELLRKFKPSNKLPVLEVTLFNNGDETTLEGVLSHFKLDGEPVTLDDLKKLCGTMFCITIKLTSTLPTDLLYVSYTNYDYYLTIIGGYHHNNSAQMIEIIIKSYDIKSCCVRLYEI